MGRKKRVTMLKKRQIAIREFKYHEILEACYPIKPGNIHAEVVGNMLFSMIYFGANKFDDFRCSTRCAELQGARDDRRVKEEESKWISGVCSDTQSQKWQ